MTENPDTAVPAGTRALVRGLALLDHVTRSADGCSLSDLAAAAAVDKGTASRLLSVLVTAGMAQRHEPSGRYLPGPALVRLGAAYAARLDLARVARPYLEALVASTGETVHFALRDGLQIVYVEHLAPDRAVRAQSAVGAVRPLHVTAMGRAILAALPTIVRTKALAALAAQTGADTLVTDLHRLDAAIEHALHHGWASVERDDDLCRVAAAVLDAQGEPVAAISVSGPTYRMRGDLHAIGERCRSTAREVCAHLAGR